MFDRIVRNWVYGGFLGGLLLAALTPVLARQWSVWQTAVWVLLPLYMIHQYEEFDDDRFLRFVNTRIGKGKEVLGHTAVFVLNVFGVWGILTVSFWLTSTVRPGLGLMAVYLVLVNAVVHIAAALVLRGYNPGLLTAVLGFAPAGWWGWWKLQAAGASGRDHAIGVAVGVGAHLVILGYSRIHLRQQGRAAHS